MALTRATDKIIANADGNLNLSGIVTATSFSGSGANLTGLPAGITINNNGTSKIITGSGTANTLNGNVNLTFDGTTLDVKSGTGIVNTGQLKVGTAATIATNGNAIFSGIVTATSDISIPNDTGKIKIGTHEDIEIYNKGNLSIIANKASGASSNNNPLHIYSFFDVTHGSAFSQYFRVGNTTGQESAGAGSPALNLISGGAVETFFNGTKRFETTNTGAIVTGILTATSFSGSGANLTGIAGGLTQADQWRVSSNFNLTAQTDTYITSNWERVDSNGYGLLGSGMSESSGEFTFPATGIYLVHLHLEAYFPSSSNPRLMARIYVTVGGGSYSFVANGNSHAKDGGFYSGSDAFYLFDVTNTSTHKVKFLLYSSGTSNAITIVGDSGVNKTYASFIRLADT